MLSQNTPRKDENFSIFVVGSIDDAIRETYVTGIMDFVFVPVNEAKKAVARLGNNHYIATNNPEIAKEYGIKLKENNTY